MHMAWHKRISKPVTLVTILKNSTNGETEMRETATLQVNWFYVNHKTSNVRKT